MESIWGIFETKEMTWKVYEGFLRLVILQEEIMRMDLVCKFYKKLTD